MCGQLQLVLYRDTVFLYKLMVADHTHIRSIKLKRWTKDQAVLDWRLKELSRNRDSARLNVGAFNQVRVWVPVLCSCSVCGDILS